MKTAKKIISIVLALLLKVGMVSLNGTTSVYAFEENNDVFYSKGNRS